MIAVDDGKELFCAEMTRLAGEPLYGTATTVKTWLLLEYRLPWRAKATEDNELPARVQAFFKTQLAAIPGSRLLFIKQENAAQGPLRFFLVRCDEFSPLTYEIQFTDYLELTGLDMPLMASGGEAFAGYKHERPIYLVCTNGTRDKCCAKYGLPMVRSLTELAGGDVWQASHMGGHRYAPNVLVLPYSVNYGLMTENEAGPLVAATEKGQTADLAFLRGRTYYVPEVQAADYFLRQATGLKNLTGIALKSVEPLGDDRSRISFHAPDDQIRQIVVQRQEMEEAQWVSCSAPKTKPIIHYQLIDI